MAEIKINNLKIDAEKSEEMIDLRSDAEASNSKALLLSQHCAEGWPRRRWLKHYLLLSLAAF